MVYVKEPPPAYGANQSEVIRYLDHELEKIAIDSERLNGVLEAVNINGVSATWFWDDTNLGDPAAGEMRADSNTMAGITQINVSFIDAQGRDITQVLKTSTIEPADLLGLINVSGLGAGNYSVNGEVLFVANHIEIPVINFQGQSGNPTNRDIMAMRWEFSTAPPQKVI